MDNSGLQSENEVLKRSEKSLLSVIEELENQQNEARTGNEFKKLSKMKKNIDEKRAKLAEVQAHIAKFEAATENFVNEQKLESNLQFMEETNTRKLEELKQEHASQITELKLQLKNEQEEAEREMTEKQLQRKKKSTEALDLEKKIEFARKKEDWDNANYYQDKLEKVEKRDEEVNYQNNRKFINDKLAQLQMAQTKRVEKETRAKDRQWHEKSLELKQAYDTVVKNSKNMQNNIRNEQNKLQKKCMNNTMTRLMKSTTSINKN